MLYFIATPIGNLQDITYRAVDVLRSCDYILCEDTRRSRILLQHYGIDKPLKSFHRFKEAKQEDKIISDLEQGLHIALLSDAGTPTINDPGQRLAQRCHREELPFTALPGPCALIDALVLSGFSSEAFQFIGFLPKKPGKKRKALQQMLSYSGTSICFETPHSLIKTLAELAKLDPERLACVARELTKVFEEIKKGPASLLHAHYTAHPPKGEMVLLIAEKST